MSDGAARLAARYRRVWHVIEADGAGPWLTETGLLPAADLYRLAGSVENGTNRDDFHTLELGHGRIAVLRPQLMTDRTLTATLGGSFTGRPDAWRRHINAHVFFWPEPRRRDGFVGACGRLRARGSAEPIQTPPRVLAIDTAALLSRHGARAYFARINTGAVLRGGARVRRDENDLRAGGELPVGAGGGGGRQRPGAAARVDGRLLNEAPDADLGRPMREQRGPPW